MAKKEADFIEIDFQDPKNVFKALLDDDNTPIANIDKIFNELYSTHSATPGKRKKVPTKKQRNATISLATTDLSKILVEYIYDLMAYPIAETANLPMNTIDFLEILKVIGTNRASKASIDHVLDILKQIKNKKLQNTIINIIADKNLAAESAKSKNAKPATDMKILMAMATYAPSPIDYLQDPLYKLIKYTKSLSQKEMLAVAPQILEIIEQRTIAELKKKNIDYTSVDALCLFASDITRLPAPFSKEFIDDIMTRYFHTQMSEQKDQLAYFMKDYKTFLLPEKKKPVKKQEKQKKGNKKKSETPALSKSNRFDSPQTVFNTLKSFDDLTKIYNELAVLSKSRNKITQSKINKVIGLAPNKKIQRLVEHICTQINLPLKKSINAPISVQEYLAIISVMSTQNFDPEAMKTTLKILPRIRNKKAKKEIIDIINWKYNNPAFIKEHFSELITAQPNKIPVLAQLLMADIIYANDDYMAQRRYMKQLAGYLEQIGTDKIITMYNQIIPEIKKLISAELKEAKANDSQVSKVQLKAYCDFVMTMALYNPMLSDKERNIIAVRYSYDNIIAADDMQKFFASGYKKLLSSLEKKPRTKPTRADKNNNQTTVIEDDGILLDDSVEILGDDQTTETFKADPNAVLIDIPETFDDNIKQDDLTFVDIDFDKDKIENDNVDDQGYGESEDAYDRLLKKFRAFKQEIDKILDEIGNSNVAKKVTKLYDEFVGNVKTTVRKNTSNEFYQKMRKAKHAVEQAAEDTISKISDFKNKPNVRKVRKELRDAIEKGTRTVVNKIDEVADQIQKVAQKRNEQKR